MADRNSGDSYTSYEDITKHTSCLKLTDFGLSHIISDGDKVTFAKFACGTHNYKAPELINVYNILNIFKNSQIDKSVDMWSFGVMLYQMATAYLPSSIKKFKYGNT